MLEYKILQKQILLTWLLISLILGDTLYVTPSEEIQSVITDIPETLNKFTIDSLNIDLDGEIFESRMEEAKSLNQLIESQIEVENTKEKPEFHETDVFKEFMGKKGKSL